ncbi:MAG: radical SAM protein [Phycisphaerales bacterium]
MTTIDAPSVLPQPLTSGNFDPRLEPIRAKVLAGKRLSLEDGAVLYDTVDIWGVLDLAKLVRDRMHPGVAYYNINRHLNYSNVCALSCKFCEFYRKKGEDGEYTRDLDYIREQGRKAVESGATEMHIVGGLNPYLPFEYYTDMLRALREVAPQVHLKAFTAVELVHLARIAKVYKREDPKIGVRWVLEKLKEAGLGSLPGGGAEVFDERVHKEAFQTRSVPMSGSMSTSLPTVGAQQQLHDVVRPCRQGRRARTHFEILRLAGPGAQRPRLRKATRTATCWGVPESAPFDAPVITLSARARPLTRVCSSRAATTRRSALPFFPDVAPSSSSFPRARRAGRFLLIA